MKFLILFTLITSQIIASNLLTYNVYERTDRVDVMLSFDAPYEGSIYQKKGENYISLTLNDLIFDEKVQKNINSKIIQELNITPSNNKTMVELFSQHPISVVASKTVDGFGLRIRSRLLTQSANNSLKKDTTQAQNTQKAYKQNTTLQENSLVDTRYILVVGVLFILVIFLLWLKSKILNSTQKHSGKVPANWLFKNVKTEEMMNVLYQKPLDNQNRVVLFDFQGRQYLVMTGNSNVLLDKINESNIQNESEFQEVFEQNRQKLDEYLKIQQDPLENYKEKVSQDYNPQQI